MNIVSPSILSSDFSNLEREIRRMEQAGADWLHIDVMDGHFVPNLTLGAPVVRCLREKTKLFFDVHLMISDPLAYLGDFAAAGADLITFHLESDSDCEKTLKAIRAKGLKAGLSIKPGTPAQALFPYLSLLDLALVMTVEPGFGGQSFMADMLPKVAAIKAEASRLRLPLDLQVDGGINDKTAGQAVEAGANVLVAGSYVFGASDPAQAVSILKNAGAAR